MKRILMAGMIAALALPAAQSVAAPAGNLIIAARDSERHRVRDRHRVYRGDWNSDTRMPNAWQQRYPSAVVAQPRWSRGDRLYRNYWGPNYYVDDWQSHHLRRPPRGYRWVHVDDDYLLVAITTGIILDLLLNQDRRYDH